MRTFARGLQLIGLILPITAILMGMSTRGMLSMSLEFGIAFAGVAIFVLGWWLQGKTES